MELSEVTRIVNHKGDTITDVKLLLKSANGDSFTIGKSIQEAKELFDEIYSQFKQKRRVFDYYEHQKEKEE